MMSDGNKRFFIFLILRTSSSLTSKLVEKHRLAPYSSSNALGSFLNVTKLREKSSSSLLIARILEVKFSITFILFWSNLKVDLALKVAMLGEKNYG
jgi:hypothetical protein